MSQSKQALSERLNRRFPSLAELEAPARRRLPAIAFDYLEGGIGDEGAVRRNREALDRVELVPRYGVDVGAIDPSVRLFGRSYPLPFGIAPMGLANMVWPQADRMLTTAAQAAGIPYVLSTVGTTSIEAAARLAPDVLWFQLYGIDVDDHAVSRDLIRRARDAGAHVLVVTLDIPVRARRRRDIRNGMTLPFRVTPGMIADALRHPRWSAGVLRYGRPYFASLVDYAEAGDPVAATALHRNRQGAFRWRDIARFRDLWPGPLVVKGILCPEDAEQAVAVGVDGIQVSNHGGRQFDAAPAAIHVLPAIRAAVGERAAVLFDSGIRSGLDVVRALALGADFAFVGRPFLRAVAALGPAGPAHVVAVLEDEIRTALGQMGVAADGHPSWRTLRRYCGGKL